MSIHDDIRRRLKEPAPEGWRPQPGDELVGTVDAIAERDSDYGQPPYRIVTLRLEDGRRVDIHGFHEVLRKRFAYVQRGDVLGVLFEGKRPGRSAEYDSYRVEHEPVGPRDPSPAAAARRVIVSSPNAVLEPEEPF